MHLNARLAPCPGYGWSGGPQFKTDIETLESGDEFRNAAWIQARHTFSAPFLNISRPAFREIKRMFMVCRGMTYAFRFLDELDFEASGETFATGNGTTDTFQLGKFSTADGVQYFRQVHALISRPTITINGTATTAFSINLRTGQLRFTTPPANGAVLAWSGTFEIWVRFASDVLSFSLDSTDGTNGEVQLIEDRPPVEAIPA